jgi:methionine salvage enolase-phosphatase E1
LFVSDVAAELEAARSAGMQCLFSLRPGNYSEDAAGFTIVRSFDEI